MLVSDLLWKWAEAVPVAAKINSFVRWILIHVLRIHQTLFPGTIDHWHFTGPPLPVCWVWEMAELLTLSLRETPATLLRKPISATMNFKGRDLVLLVIPSLMTIGEDRNEDQTVDQELCLADQLSFRRSGAVKRTHSLSLLMGPHLSDLCDHVKYHCHIWLLVEPGW